MVIIFICRLLKVSLVAPWLWKIKISSVLIIISDVLGFGTDSFNQYFGNYSLNAWQSAKKSHWVLDRSILFVINGLHGISILFYRTADFMSDNFLMLANGYMWKNQMALQSFSFQYYPNNHGRSKNSSDSVYRQCPVCNWNLWNYVAHQHQDAPQENGCGKYSPMIYCTKKSACKMRYYNTYKSDRACECRYRSGNNCRKGDNNNSCFPYIQSAAGRVVLA